MAQSASLQTQGLEKILKKLDVKKMTAPVERYVLQDLMQAGGHTLQTLLAPQYPVTAQSVRTSEISNLRGDQQAIITAERDPYVYAERGSQYPNTIQFEGKTLSLRRHRRRRGVKVGALRQKPRRFLSKTRAYVRKGVPAALQKAASAIEKDWVSG